MTKIIAQQMAEATKIVDDAMEAISLPPEAGQTPLDRHQMIEVVRLALEFGPVAVLEVGLGWGASAAALQASGAVHRHVIAAWDDDRPRFEAGCRNARLHGARGVEIHEGESQFILPALASKGLKFDLALIDGGHRFDDVFLDAWYCGRMLRPGGFLLLDDTWMPSIQAVVEWLRTNMGGVWMPVETTIANFAIFQRRAAQDGQVAPDERHWAHFVPFGTAAHFTFDGSTASASALARHLDASMPLDEDSRAEWVVDDRRPDVAKDVRVWTSDGLEEIKPGDHLVHDADGVHLRPRVR